MQEELARLTNAPEVIAIAMNALTNTSPEYRHTRSKDRSTPRLDLLDRQSDRSPSHD